MNNLIKYLLYLLVALLLISWLITVGKSCGKPDAAPDINSSETYEITDQQDSTVQADSIDFKEELKSILDEEEELQSIVEDDEDLDYSAYDPEKDAPKAKKQESSPKTNPAPPVSTKSTVKATPKPSSSGSYMVIVGSYIRPDNADRQKSKIDKLGYSGEVVVFDLSEYYTVLAGRYADQSAAQRIVDQLSAKGVDAYVKKQTF